MRPAHKGYCRTGNHENPYQNEKLYSANALPTSLAVIPRQNESDQKPDREKHVNGSLNRPGQVPRLSEHLDALEHQPRTGKVGESPVKKLAFSQTLKDRRHKATALVYSYRSSGTCHTDRLWILWISRLIPATIRLPY